MEKRFVLFLILTMMIVVGYNALVVTFGPPRAPQKKVAKDQAKDGDTPIQDLLKAEKESPPSESEPDKKRADATAEPPFAEKETKSAEKPEEGKPEEKKPEEKKPAIRQHSHRLVTLGSYRGGNSPLLAVLNSHGASLESVELVARTAKGELRYRDLDNTAGYLGNLSLTVEAPGGCRVQVVPPETPAALAVPSSPNAGTGLQVGDVILSMDGKRVATPVDLDAALAGRKSNDVVKLGVERSVEGKAQAIEYSATLSVRPLELIRPEPLEKGELRPHPESLLLDLRDATREKEKLVAGLHYVDWEVVEGVGADTVEFRYVIDDDRAADFGLSQPAQVIKRYRLGTSQAAAGKPNDAILLPYHLAFDIEIRNLGQQPQKLTYALDGTNGLPTEGWWYSAKIHPQWFHSAGARDIVLRTQQGGQRLIGCPSIVSRAKKEEKSPETPLFGSSEPTPSRSILYVGVDTQYFAAALMPAKNQKGEGNVVFSRAEARVLGDVTKKPKGWDRTANVSYQLMSAPIALAPDQMHREEFTLFLGPKEPEVLATYGLNELIYHGWFGAVSRVLSSLLHIFHNGTGNYAIAIVMLTVLVRGCMFPLSRKAAKNAAMMQELGPEMRKIAEKYKNNMEARGKAQQELFRKHNYNPFSGCWMMFLQLPVFIGLYRCLAIDIKLRQAPLISGIEWASNLAGPDKLFYWKNGFLSFLTDESGWLGPFFNLLPLFTIALFLVHQKLFTPPATDEQTAMQLKMMKFMTIFMGVLFYKVPAGLCIYFIASSLWGIAERKLLPKPTAQKPGLPPDEPPKKFQFPNPFAPKTDGNGSSRKRPTKRPKRK